MNVMTRAASKHFAIREATPADAAELARVHVSVWQSTYRGIMPDAFLDALTPRQREPYWTQILSADDPPMLRLVLAAEDGMLGGFLTAGAPQNLPAGGASSYRGEVYSLNILPSLQGRGFGRRLLVHAALWLAERRMTPFYLWVLADNVNARDFFELLGGMPSGQRVETIGGARLAKMAYQFINASDMARLALKSSARR